MDQDSSVSIATALWPGRSGDRIPLQARFSAPVQTGPGAHPASCTMGTGFFPGVKWPGRGVDNSPHLAPRLKKELLPLWAFVVCSRGNFTSLLFNAWQYVNICLSAAIKIPEHRY